MSAERQHVMTFSSLFFWVVVAFLAKCTHVIFRRDTALCRSSAQYLALTKVVECRRRNSLIKSAIVVRGNANFQVGSCEGGPLPVLMSINGPRKIYLRLVYRELNSDECRVNLIPQKCLYFAFHSLLLLPARLATAWSRAARRRSLYRCMM